MALPMQYLQNAITITSYNRRISMKHSTKMYSSQIKEENKQMFKPRIINLRIILLPRN